MHRVYFLNFDESKDFSYIPFLLPPHLDDGLSEEIIRLSGELLSELGLEVVVLVPHADLDPVAGVVALAGKGN